MLGRIFGQKPYDLADIFSPALSVQWFFEKYLEAQLSVVRFFKRFRGREHYRFVNGFLMDWLGNLQQGRKSSGHLCLLPVWHNESLL